MKYMNYLVSIVTLSATLFVVGCQREPSSSPKPGKESSKGSDNTHANHGGHKSHDKDSTKIASARAKLSSEDRKMVDAQEYCPVMEEHRLGVMGSPFKIILKDQPVFLCCDGCRKNALANPDQTLAKVKELKAKMMKEAGN